MSLDDEVDDELDDKPAGLQATSEYIQMPDTVSSNYFTTYRCRHLQPNLS